jgi:cytochrome c
MRALTKLKKIMLVAVVLALPSSFVAAGDAVKGAKVYKKCVSCHMIGDGAKNRVGPQLNGIIGREIAAIGDYKYSKAMVKYAATAKIWSEENLAAYLESPRKLVKGGRMAFAGLRKEKDRANIIAYLKENAK